TTQRKNSGHSHGLLWALTGWITADGLLGQASPVFAQTAGPSWSYTGNLNEARAGHTETLLRSGKVLVVGHDRLGSAELYDPATGTWRYTGILNTARARHTATLLKNGKVLIARGLADSTSSVEDDYG